MLVLSTCIFFVAAIREIRGLQLDQGTLGRIKTSYNLRVPCSRHVVNFRHIQSHPLPDPVYDRSCISLRAIMENGKEFNVSLSVSEVASDGFRRELVQKTGIFDNSYNVYTRIIPRFQEMIMDYGDSSEPIFLDMLDAQEGRYIITADNPNDKWKEGSSEMLTTVKDLGLVLRSMAKWHAISAVLLENQHIFRQLFNESLVIRNRNYTFPYYAVLLQNFAELIRVTWDNKWDNFANQVENNVGVIGQKILNIHHTGDESRFKVLNLGDLHVKNMLFNFGITDAHCTDNPIAVKFVSFDMVHVNSPAFDVNSFIYISHPIAMENRDHLVRNEYHPALINYLSKYGFKGVKPSLSGMEAELRRTELLGIVDSINFHTSYIFESDASVSANVVDLVEESWKSGKLKVNMSGMLRDEFSVTMKIIMERVQRENILA